MTTATDHALDLTITIYCLTFTNEEYLRQEIKALTRATQLSNNHTTAMSRLELGQWLWGVEKKKAWLHCSNIVCPINWISCYDINSIITGLFIHCIDTIKFKHVLGLALSAPSITPGSVLWLARKCGRTDITLHDRYELTNSLISNTNLTTTCQKLKLENTTLCMALNLICLTQIKTKSCRQ